MLWISVKFHENILIGFQLKEQTLVIKADIYIVPRGVTPKKYTKELLFLRFARRQMMI